jgi:hypothetical protein
MMLAARVHLIVRVFIVNLLRYYENHKAEYEWQTFA